MKTVERERVQSQSTSPTFRNLFLHTLRDLWSAEHQIIQALPQLIKAVEDADLKTALQNHLRETRGQVTRLKKIFSGFRESPEGVFCKGMKGLLDEGYEIFKKKGHSHVKDAALIAACQRVEHYEIAVYGTARAYAKQLGYSDVATLLEASLDEEGGADKTLSKLAVGGIFTNGINKEAADASEGRRSMDPRRSASMVSGRSVRASAARRSIKAPTSRASNASKRTSSKRAIKKTGSHR